MLYNHAEDAAAFDKHYDEVHSSLANKLRGVRRYTICRSGPDLEGNQPAYHLVAVLEFDDAGAFQAALENPEGQAALADLENFAGAGLTLLPGPAYTV